MNLEPKLAWVGCCMLAKKDGVVPISTAPDGIYRRKFGEWEIALNGTGEQKAKSEAHPALPPFNAYVQFNGWPAGIIGPDGGPLAAGSAANEDTFIAAIEAELGCTIDAALTGHETGGRNG